MSAHNLLQEWGEAPHAIPDPGTGAAIPVQYGVAQVNFVIAASASETNTLADPTAPGQILFLHADTLGSGGSRAVTAASAVNQTGNTVMTFGAAKDFCGLIAVTVAGAPKWVIFCNDGAGLS